MRKIYFIIIFALNMILTIKVSGQVVMYTTADLNLRQLPSISSKVITIIPKGTGFAFQVYVNKEWQFVSYNSMYEGYINSRYLSRTKPNSKYTHSSYSTQRPSIYYYNEDDDDNYYYESYRSRTAAYDAGYEQGQEDGYDDGSNCHYHGYSYDDSDCSGRYCADYEDGYSSGYDDGYYSGKDDCEEDEDDD